MGSNKALSVSQSRLFKVLIVGCGKIAGRFDMERNSRSLPFSHAGAYAKHKGFQLTGCVDPSIERLKEFSKYWSIKNAVTSFEKLEVGLNDFDVISICSPTELHEAHIDQALELLPRVIFCEKPLTTDVSGAEKLYAKCYSAGVNLVVNFSRRWDPSVQEFASQLLSDRWGKVRSVVAYYNKGVLNNGSHMVDLLLRLFGPMELVTTSSVVFDYLDDDPTVSALLTAKNGSVPIYLCSSSTHDFSYFEVEFVCEKGVVRMISGGLGWQSRLVTQDPIFTGYRSLAKTIETQGRYAESMTRAVQDIYSYLQTPNSNFELDTSPLDVQRLCIQIRDIALTTIVNKTGKL